MKYSSALALFVASILSFQTLAQQLIFDDPSMASHNIAIINSEIAANGVFKKPSGGKIYINGPIVCPNFCLLEGDTDAHSPIVIDQSFVGPAVISTAPEEPSIEIRRIKFLFEQGNIDQGRSGLFPYPPFIKTLSGRAKFIDISISGGIDGIIADNAGNAGGMFLERVKLGNFGTNLFIDHALDFVFMDMVEIWPFDYAKSHLNTWSDGQTVAFHFKDVDGLTAGSIASFRAKAIIEKPDGPKKPFGSIETLQLDGSNAGLYMDGGEISIANAYSTSDKLDDIAIEVKSGNLLVGNLRISGPATALGNLVKVSSEGSLKISNFNDQTYLDVEDDIQKLYRIILQRQVARSDSGYLNWSNALSTGTSLSVIAESFLLSQEATNLYGGVNVNQLSSQDQVVFCYQALLGRTPSSSAIQNWSQLTLSGMVEGLLNSQEYQNR